MESFSGTLYNSLLVLELPVKLSMKDMWEVLGTEELEIAYKVTGIDVFTPYLGVNGNHRLFGWRWSFQHIYINRRADLEDHWKGGEPGKVPGAFQVQVALIEKREQIDRLGITEMHKLLKCMY